MPRRESLLLNEMIDAAEQAMSLIKDRSIEDIRAHRQIRDALLWNFTVLGEAASQLPDAFKAEHSAVNWSRPSQLRNRIVHGYWSIASRFCTPPRRSISPVTWRVSTLCSAPWTEPSRRPRLTRAPAAGACR